jgi:hypothetical protein
MGITQLHLQDVITQLHNHAIAVEDIEAMSDVGCLSNDYYNDGCLWNTYCLKSYRLVKRHPIEFAPSEEYDRPRSRTI